MNRRQSHRKEKPDESNHVGGVMHEFLEFLRFNKKWWLTPIVIVVLLLAAAVLLAPSPVAPFIYSLF